MDDISLRRFCLWCGERVATAMTGAPCPSCGLARPGDPSATMMRCASCEAWSPACGVCCEYCGAALDFTDRPSPTSPPALQPLRVPGGWHLQLNLLHEIDPSLGAMRQGYFGGSSLLTAVHRPRGAIIDIEWRPADDPEGQYCLRVMPLADANWHAPRALVATPWRAAVVSSLEAWLRHIADYEDWQRREP